jgi:hypothetical protein
MARDVRDVRDVRDDRDDRVIVSADTDVLRFPQVARYAAHWISLEVRKAT